MCSSTYPLIQTASPAEPTSLGIILHIMSEPIFAENHYLPGYLSTCYIRGQGTDHIQTGNKGNMLKSEIIVLKY
jgi:hypothetical protein